MEGVRRRQPLERAEVAARLETFNGRVHGLFAGAGRGGVGAERHATVVGAPFPTAATAAEEFPPASQWRFFFPVLPRA